MIKKPAIDEMFMNVALEEAQKAAHLGEVPIGAILVHKDKIIAHGHNQKEQEQDPIRHAEIIAIQEAARHLKSWRLIDTVLYVTLEPCLMCAGAILQARIPRLVFGASDLKAGACGSLYAIHQDTRLNHQIDITQGIQEEACQKILELFFQQLRLDQTLAMK